MISFPFFYLTCNYLRGNNRAKGKGKISYWAKERCCSACSSVAVLPKNSWEIVSFSCKPPVCIKCFCWTLQRRWTKWLQSRLIEFGMGWLVWLFFLYVMIANVVPNTSINFFSENISRKNFCILLRAFVVTVGLFLLYSKYPICS